MRHSEGTVGRVFVLRFEDGDQLPGLIEEFAREHDIRSAMLILVGGLGSGKIVVGPEKDEMPPVPVLLPFAEPHEVAGVGTLFWGDDGPSVHLHGALGRGERTITGCLRPGVDTWLVAEAVILEICGCPATRQTDPVSGFQLLAPEG